jgi:hypothetical protein
MFNNKNHLLCRKNLSLEINKGKGTPATGHQGP